MGIGIFYFEGGLMTDVWSVNDMFSVSTQLGAL